jgi:hypothetical protein
MEMLKTKKAETSGPAFMYAHSNERRREKTRVSDFSRI